MFDQREIDRKAKQRVATGVAVGLALVAVGVSMVASDVGKLTTSGQFTHWTRAAVVFLAAVYNFLLAYEAWHYRNSKKV